MFERGLSYLKKARTSAALVTLVLWKIAGPYEAFATDPRGTAPSKLAKRLLLLLLLSLLLRDSRHVYEAGKRTFFRPRRERDENGI